MFTVGLNSPSVAKYAKRVVIRNSIASDFFDESDLIFPNEIMSFRILSSFF